MSRGPRAASEPRGAPLQPSRLPSPSGPSCRAPKSRRTPKEKAARFRGNALLSAVWSFRRSRGNVHQRSSLEPAERVTVVGGHTLRRCLCVGTYVLELVAQLHVDLASEDR